MVGAAVAFVLLQPAKVAYREAVWGDVHGRGGTTSVQDRVSIWSDAVSETVDEGSVVAGPGARNQGLIGRSMERTAELLPIAQVIAWVPDRIDYSYGGQWWAAVTGWIPRFLWPGKPNATFEVNGRYAVEFRLQTREGIRRAVSNVGQIVDGYRTFGWIGVAAAALVFGLAVGWLGGALPATGWGSYAVGGFFLLTIAYHASASIFVSGLPQRLGGAIAWCWVVASLSAAVQRNTRAT